MLHRNLVACIVSLGCVGSVVGCSANAEEPGAAEGVTSTEEPILGGNAVGVGLRRSLGLVAVNTGCSGTLLTPDWVITAGHCIPDFNSPSGSTFDLPRGGLSFGSDRRLGDLAIRPNDLAASAANVIGSDVAIVHLQGTAPATWPTSVSNTVNNNASPSTLVNQTATCYGQGFTAYGANGFLGTQAWRLLVKALGPFQTNNTFQENAIGGSLITTPGDSGASCMLNNGQIAAIVSYGGWTCSDTRSDATCKGTITSVQSANWASVTEFATFIAGLPGYVSAAGQQFKPAAFQASDHNLWIDQNLNAAIAGAGLAMAPHTVPGVAQFANGSPAIAVQASTGHMWTVVNGVLSDQFLGMSAGTSPSIAVLPNGQVAVAAQANTGTLWLNVNGANSGQGVGMMPGTSPSIAALPNGQIAVAFQAGNGHLWIEVNGVATDQQLGMMAGTSPSIAALSNGQTAVAFQANTGELWLDVNGVPSNTHFGMKAGTSPSLAILAGGQKAVAFQANTGNLYFEADGTTIKDLQKGMAPSASPTMVALPNGLAQISFESNAHEFWFETVGVSTTGVGLDTVIPMDTP
jgi:hypothetical protein